MTSPTTLADRLKTRREEERAGVDLLAAKGRPPGLNRMLSTLRAKQMATLAEAGAAAGVTSDVWAHWEAGEAVPDTDQIDAMVAAWGLTVRDRTTLRNARSRALGLAATLPAETRLEPDAGPDSADEPTAPTTSKPISVEAAAERILNTPLGREARASVALDREYQTISVEPAAPPPAQKPADETHPLAGFLVVVPEFASPDSVVVNLASRGSDIQLRKGARDLLGGRTVKRVHVLIHKDGSALAVVPHRDTDEVRPRSLPSRGDISVSQIRKRLVKAGWPEKAAYRVAKQARTP